MCSSDLKQFLSNNVFKCFFTACDQGCHRELMAIEDDMERELSSLRESISKAKPIPHKRLARINTSVSTLFSLLDSIGGEGHYSLLAKVVKLFMSGNLHLCQVYILSLLFHMTSFISRHVSVSIFISKRH